MIRTIYVTGGRKDYAEMTLTDKKGHDLSTGITLRLGVTTTPTPGPAPTTWYAVDLATYPAVGTAVLSLLCDSTRTPPGTYWLWADVPDSPTTQPVCSDQPFITL